MSERTARGHSGADRSTTSAKGLAIGVSVLLLTAGLSMIGGGALGAPSDPPEIKATPSLNVEPGQEIIIHARNLNNDLTNIWSVSVSPSVSGDSFTSSDRHAQWRWAMPSGFSGSVDVTFTLEDGEGKTDTHTTTITASSNPTLEQLDPIDVETGEVVSQPTEDTDIKLRLGGPGGMQGVTIFKNYPNTPKEATEVSSGTWVAEFNYANPGTHITGYKVTGSGGANITLIDAVEILDAPPTINVRERYTTAPEQTFQITAFAEDDDGSPINWNVVPSMSGATVSTSGQTATVEWYVPADWDGPTQSIDWTAADANSGQSSSTTTDITFGDADVDPALPFEVDTPLATRNPITGETLRFSVDVDDPAGTTVDSVEVYPEGLGNGPLSAHDSDDDGVYDREGFDYPDAGSRTVGYRVNDANGGSVTVLQVIVAMDNTAPVVDAGEDILAEAENAAGATVSLRGHATDPEMRILSDDAYVWDLPDAATMDTVTGQRAQATLPVGIHNVILGVTDPYEARGTDFVQVIVDDSISANGALANAQGQSSDGTWIVDPAMTAGEELEGQVTVTDDQGNPVEGATVEGVVTYYGQSPVETAEQIATIDTEAGTDGVAPFSFDQDVSTGDTSLLSAPGYHEISLDITSDSRDGAPVMDTETTTTTIGYWVTSSLLQG